MRWPYKLPLRLRSLSLKSCVERELSDELRFHLEKLVEQKVAKGFPAEEARYAALRDLGGLEQIKEECRDMRRVNLVTDTIQDLRYGLRVLARSPGFTAVAVLTLALGIGANTAVFTLLDAILFRLLPVQKAEQLYQVRRVSPDVPERLSGDFTNPLWENLRARQDVFSGMAAWGNTEFNLARGGAVQRAQGLWVSGGYFGTLGVRPALGRIITPADDYRGCPAIAVLSYSFWQDRYAGATSAVGSAITLDSHPFEVVGVSEPGFFGMDVGMKFDVAAPNCATALLDGPTNSRLDDRSSWWLAVVGRVKPGLLPQLLNARLAAVAPEVSAASLPEDWDAQNKETFLKTSLAAVPAGSGTGFDLREHFRQPLAVLMAVVGLVLLIACANIAALMLARAAAQSRETAVRFALGATRMRLIRQLLTHSVMLSIAGAAAGVLLAHWGTSLLVRCISTHNENLFFILTPDLKVLGFTVAVALLTGALFGMLPALRSARVSVGDPLRGSTVTQTERRSKWHRWIVASQIALSLMLLVTAGLFLRSFVKLALTDTGLARRNVLLVTANLWPTAIKPEDRPATLNQIQARLRALPGVVSVGRSEDVPLSGRRSANYVYADTPNAPSGDDSVSLMMFMSPGYFSSMGMAMLAGRDFTESDTQTTPRVAVVNQAFARKYFGSVNPIGHAIHIASNRRPGPPIEVVGIVADADYVSLREKKPPTAFFPIQQYPGREGQMTFEIRTAGHLGGLESAVERTVASANHEVPLEFNTLERLVDDAMVQERLLAMLSVFFGAVALLLAMIGLYGTINYRVTLRRAEFGIRMALGAQAGGIARLVIRDVAIILLAGEAAGIGISLVAATALRSLLFGLGPRDATTMAGAGLLLGCVALFAGYIPARRAARVDPMVALKYE
ncbi:MAG TPA: ABC transporter permease [Terriglobia bacterium]|nr:ABC transporter permease [Terriglobia bacterium]